jgi:hypothetical protein
MLVIIALIETITILQFVNLVCQEGTWDSEGDPSSFRIKPGLQSSPPTLNMVIFERREKE